MEMHVRVLVQEILHLGCLGRQVVENDVDLLLRLAGSYDTTQEIHELFTGVARGPSCRAPCPCAHPARRKVREFRGDSIRTRRVRSAPATWQHRIESVQ